MNYLSRVIGLGKKILGTQPRKTELEKNLEQLIPEMRNEIYKWLDPELKQSLNRAEYQKYYESHVVEIERKRLIIICYDWLRKPIFEFRKPKDRLRKPILGLREWSAIFWPDGIGIRGPVLVIYIDTISLSGELYKMAAWLYDGELHPLIGMDDISHVQEWKLTGDIFFHQVELSHWTHGGKKSYHKRSSDSSFGIIKDFVVEDIIHFLNELFKSIGFIYSRSINNR